MASKFKKNDKVLIIAGASKGKQGKILSIKNDRVVVEGVNLATIHKKPTQSEAGSIVKKEKSIHISNISHINEGKAEKVKFVINKDSDKGKKFQEKERVLKKTEVKIDN